MGIIGTIRKHSWIAVAVVGIAIICFIIGDLTKNTNRVPDMGKIGKTTITYQHFNYLMDETEENYKRNQEVSQIPDEVRNQLREQVWQRLVGETLINTELDKLGMTVSNAELSDMYLGDFIHPYLRQIFTDPKTGTYQSQAIQYYIDNFENLDTAQRRDWVELEKSIKEDRCQQKYNALISRGLYMPNAIAQQMAEMGNELSNVNIVSLAYQTVPEEEVALTDADYEKYYNAHRNEYRVREELRELEYITYPIVPTPQDIENIQKEVENTWNEFQTIPEDELIFFVNGESNSSYDSTFRKAEEFASPIDSAIRSASVGSFISPRIVGNEWQMAKILEIENRPDSIRSSIIYIFNERVRGNITRGDEQAKQLADSVMNIVRNGAMTFEEAVNQYSDDPQKANNNGDMGWMVDGTWGFLSNQLMTTTEGGVFVIRHPNEIGYWVVKVTGKTPLHRKYRVASIVRPIVASEATTRNIYNEANKFAGNNRTYSAMLNGAQTENLQIRHGMVDAMSYNLGGIRNARSIIQWAFNEETEIGSVANQVFEVDDQYIVVALKDVYKVGYATLDQVRSMMESQVRIQKKAEILKERINEAKKDVDDLNAIAVKLNTTIDTIDSVSFNDYFLGKYGMEPKVQSAIVASTGDKIVGPIQGANGMYLLKVTGKVANPNPTEAQNIQNQLQQNYQQKLRSVQQVMKDNTKVVDQRNKFF